MSELAPEKRWPWLSVVLGTVVTILTLVGIIVGVTRAYYTDLADRPTEEEVKKEINERVNSALAPVGIQIGEVNKKLDRIEGKLDREEERRR